MRDILWIIAYLSLIGIVVGAMIGGIFVFRDWIIERREYRIALKREEEKWG